MSFSNKFYPDLNPGDHLLYGRKDLFGFITSIKTWSPAVHVEEFIGLGKSVASRNGIGVNIYPVRWDNLIAILQPKQTINIAKALTWFNEEAKGLPYGWLDLLSFYNIRIKTSGLICSQFVSMFDNAGDFHPFADGYSCGMIDPGDYFVSPLFVWKWIRQDAYEAIKKM